MVDCKKPANFAGKNNKKNRRSRFAKEKNLEADSRGKAKNKTKLTLAQRTVDMDTLKEYPLGIY